ncbi:hypothetical protein WH87_03225 [Devosia epidermidihirudinis]|uniref:Enoyl reductase (ER) domain-containing protein n=1 Tax=Devosia epidermidihirudinis TaxID=1293439 RepID=A0A0F5QGH7_9HYPH|nr:NAD(P)-dependent alcohol dehydrogenase [Devosia epidermidihirudinis]KKC39861.1 hypothetical protein WH87_03225 [Devosia epidermidihirudinis]
MRALVTDRYGPPHTMRLEQLPQPQPGLGEVLVRIHATSVNSWDWDRLVGRPLGRISDPFRPPHRILGGDIAGIVAAVGDGVAHLKVGDAVFGDLTSANWGGFADYVCAPASALAIKPEGLSFHAAAALPQAGLLAMQAVRLRTGLASGERVLVCGAGGGAGIIALQLARHAGAQVTAVDRGHKGDRLRELGASHFIDYRQQNFTRTGQRYDLIIDMVGSQSVFGYRRALEKGGNLVLVGGSFGRIVQVVALGHRLGREQSQRMELLIYKPSVDDLDQLAALTLSGVITPVIDSVFTLEQGPDAMRRIGSGDHIGKIIIDMGA